MIYPKIVDITFFPSYIPDTLPFGTLETTCCNKAKLISDLLEEEGDFKIVMKPQM